LGGKIKKQEIRGARIMHGGEKRLYRGSWEKPEGKRPLGRPSLRWDLNIKVDLQEIDEEVEWVNLAENRGRWWDLVIVVNILVPQITGEFLG
jgi:hypothetical protein